MLASIGRYAPAIVAGSALSGFGLAFGRDVYKKAKDKWLVVLILLLLVGVFFSGMWLFRNYRTTTETFLKKLGAGIVLAVSVVGINLLFLILIDLFAPGMLTSESGGRTIVGLLLDPPMLWIILVQIACFVLGAVMGARHRLKRAMAWEAENHNDAFMETHGLQVTDTDDKGNLRIREIATNTGYRLMENLDVTGEMEFMALGRRNKRAYIQYDETGKFTHWTGLVEVK